MCSPTAATVIPAVASGGLGIMQSVGQHNAQKRQAEYQHAANQAQRQTAINNQRLTLNVDNKRYGDRKVDRKYADREAGRAANEAYLGNQTKYNEKVNSFMVNKQSRLIKAMQDAAVVGARGQRGGSIDDLQTAITASTGRDTATALAGLRSSASQLIAGNRSIQGKLQGEYLSNFSQIGDAPMQGFTPPEVVKPPGPSSLSIAASIGQATLGAFNAGQSASTLPGGQTMGMLGGGGFNTGAPSFTGNTASMFNLGNTPW